MNGFLDELTVFSPAKVNLHLSIKDRRSDGFHNLESVFLAMDFGDNIHFFVKDSDECELEGTQVPDNIILKAVSLFKAKTGFSKGLKIQLEKRIPVGGGLGGGSSNAAATLLALNKMAGFPLNRGSLLGMASSLGSDVPFFIYETAAAWVTGRGEYIEPVDMPCMYLVLVNPGFSSSTATVFRLLDEYRANKNFSNEPHEFIPSACIRTEERYRITDSFLNFKNDFLEVFPEHEKSIYIDIIRELKKTGAVYASLSGAGSTCFGVFTQMEQAQKAADLMKGKWEFAQWCKTYYL